MNYAENKMVICCEETWYFCWYTLDMMIFLWISRDYGNVSGLEQLPASSVKLHFLEHCNFLQTFSSCRFNPMHFYFVIIYYFPMRFDKSSYFLSEYLTTNWDVWVFFAYDFIQCLYDVCSNFEILYVSRFL